MGELRSSFFANYLSIPSLIRVGISLRSSLIGFGGLCNSGTFNILKTDSTKGNFSSSFEIIIENSSKIKIEKFSYAEKFNILQESKVIRIEFEKEIFVTMRVLDKI